MHCFLLLSILASGFCLPASGQDKPALFDRLYGEQDIHIALSYPFDSLYRAQREEVAATITIETAGGLLLQDAPMNLNLRGKFRRMKCVMPPLMLNFKKSTLREMGLSTIDEIKLVTHCLEGPAGQEDLEEERMCYQVYEALSPYAYRTIRVNVTYTDEQNRFPPIHSTGFLLEPDKVISSRLSLTERKLYSIPEDSIYYPSYATTVSFNFLIGNKDWSVTASRNAKLFYSDSLEKYIVIPYDFDFSNIVGATYRRESRGTGASHPFDRLYQGEYFSDKAPDMLYKLAGAEKALLDVVASADNALDKDRRKKIARYFSSLFAFIRQSRATELQYGLIVPYKGGL